MGIDEVGTLRTLTAYREIIDAVVARDRGRIFNTAGDSVLAEFPSVVDAVQCAVDVQRALGEENAKRSPDKQMQFRIGVHVGDVLVKGDNLFGDGVNIAARLESLAESGGICVSGVVRDYVGKKLPVVFTDCGEQTVKNIAEPVRAYRVGASLAVAVAADEAKRQVLSLPDKTSIAVLPFTNLSGDPDQEYFADGVVDDILSALARFRWLFVIARNSSFTYKGKAVDIKQVGRELGVRYVLEGSLRKAGNRVRITAQLIDSTTGAHVWADRFDGALQDIFELQDQVALSIVGALQPKLRQVEIERVRRKPTDSLDAYDCYLRGVAKLQLRNREGNAEALGFFRRATELDLDYGAAYGMAAYCLQMRRGYGWATDQEGEAREAQFFIARAVETGRDDPVALYTAGWSLAFVIQDVEGGAALIDRALDLNPSDALAWGFSAHTRVYLGRPEIALEHAARAMRLSPRDPFNYICINAMTLAYVMTAQYSEAVASAERALRDYPEAMTSLRIGAIAYASCGRVEDARKLGARVLAAYPDLTLSKFKGLIPFRRPEDMDQHLTGLRLAGIPE
jgi:TolB-like protein